MSAAARMVRIQAVTISATTFQFVFCWDPRPAPITDVAAAWVVEIGTPAAVAPKIAVAAPMLAATPLWPGAG